jgi:predicted HTH transcriptional regulator
LQSYHANNKDKNLNVVSKFLTGEVMDQFELEKILMTGKVEEHRLDGVEFKESWEQRHGRVISALSNRLDETATWLVIGVNDKGQVTSKPANWARETEHTVSNHINQYLEPTWTVEQVLSSRIANQEVLLLKIRPPGSAVRWNGKAYKRIGTTTHEMQDHEILELSILLPGNDYSKEKYNGSFDPALVFDFAKHLKRNGTFDYDEGTSSAKDLLIQFGIFETNVVKILFGDCNFRVAFFNEDEQIVENRNRKGLFYLLSDAFVEEVLTWTKKRGLAVSEKSIFAHNDETYPPEAIRECIANAVAHSLYLANEGEVLVEIHPNRFCVRNNCSKDARLFVDKWYSRISRANNRHLMAFLRNARVTDELGTGKIRLLRSMLELGKRAPLIEMQDVGRHGRWNVYLYSEIENVGTKQLIEKLRVAFPSTEEWRLALALVHWANLPWSVIVGYLDAYYKQIAEKILSSKVSPILKFGESIFVKRWAEIALTGHPSRSFSIAEKTLLRNLLTEQTFKNGANGHISTDEARQILGLGASQSEVVQLSRMFRDWRDQGAVEQVRRGQWKFCQISMENK